MSDYFEGDTICAEATPRGQGGISVTRVSGPEARTLSAKLFDKPLPLGGRHRYGRISIPGAELIQLDDAVITAFTAPESYTGEDVIEIATHGSPVVVSELLEALYRLGARAASPGEFTYRAYLNGRIDLTQAEAVSDLINASSREAANAALKQLDGEIGKACEEIAKIVESLLIFTELELDFVEEDVELLPGDQRLQMAKKALNLAHRMIDGYQHSRRLREGVKVVLTGVPNVGKSSIYNAFLGESRAIVHHSPGTTRDVLSAKAIIGGIEFEFFDTAGLRDKPDEIEDEGIARAMLAVRNADIVVEVASVDHPGFGNLTPDAPLIRVTNKADIGHDSIRDSLPISAVTGEGFVAFKQLLLDKAIGGAHLTTGTINRERHYTALKRCIDALNHGIGSLQAGEPGEIIAEDWREALNALDDITGKKRLANILNTIFGQFCIGK